MTITHHMVVGAFLPVPPRSPLRLTGNAHSTSLKIVSVVSVPDPTTITGNYDSFNKAAGVVLGQAQFNHLVAVTAIGLAIDVICDSANPSLVVGFNP